MEPQLTKCGFLPKKTKKQAAFKQKPNVCVEDTYEIGIYLIFHSLPPAGKGLSSWFGICGVRRALWFLVSAGRHWRDVSRQDHPLEIWSWSYSSDRWNKGSISILQNTCLLRTNTKMCSPYKVHNKNAFYINLHQSCFCIQKSMKSSHKH